MIDSLGPPSREVMFTRIFEARRDDVFKAWTDPDRVAKWIVPGGFTVMSSSMEIAPGERWNVALLGPYGPEVRDRIVRLEVSPPEACSYTYGDGERDDRIKCEVVVSFVQTRRRTRLDLRFSFNPGEDWNETLRSQVCARGEATFDALEVYLFRH